ncbi:hypothetical protein [uncultured Cloacibacillus sp.]|uniref:hypothetical protein n=1 Tax=uncultured Cloacibacillus sp. TaxID=889794 RepID=UPI0026DACD2D|nr:hypothetical protein [uncultured Cloacibacillus sp.]
MGIYTIQTSFATGEISPSLYGRPDLAKYSAGLARCENFIIHPHGGVSKRPGMRFVAKAKGRCRLVEFEYSIDQTYVLEFGNKYVRFFRNGAQITKDGEPYELVTPYLEADLDALSFTQSADVLYIVHKGYRPMELYRVSDDEWALQDFPFRNGPFRNKTEAQADVTLALSALSGDNVTMTASAPLFEAGHEGALFELTHHVDEVMKKSSGDTWTLEVTAYKEWRLESGGFWGGEVVLEYWDEDEGAWVKYKTYISQVYDEGTSSSCGNAKNYSDQDTVDKPTKLRLRAVSFSSFVPEGNSEEDRGYFQLVAMAGYHKAVARVVSVVSSTKATVSMETEAASTRATLNWREGSWSDVLGWPSAVGFYQERLAMGATREEPQSWWLSVVGDYYDFGVSLEVLDDEAVSGTLVSRKLYDINYFVSTNKLLIMTSGGEWLLSPGAAGGALTPSNVDVGLQGNRGCARIEPVVIGNMVLFVQSRGLRIRDLGYEYVSDSYTGTDLTMLARHLFERGTIADWAFAQEPDSMCWTVMSDGSLVALTYIREQEVVAWGRFPTDGFVESVAAVVSEGADDVYLCVKRGEERFIELLSPRGVDSPEEAFFVDAGLTARFETPSREVSGLSHLEGREVVCLADGNVIEGLTVENGKVALPHAASVVHAGLPYAALLETLELVYGRQDGTQLTRRSRISSVTARVERTRGLFIGTEVSRRSPRDTSDKTGLTAVEEALLSEASQRTDERYNEPVGLYTKDYKLHLSSGWGRGRITCWAPFPLPCSILALVAEVETGG